MSILAPLLKKWQAERLFALLPILTLFLVIISAWQLSQLIWRGLYPAYPLTLSQREAEEWAVLAMAPQSTPSNLRAENLFVTPAKPVAAKPKVEAPKTALNLVLKAVFMAPIPQQSGAIIALVSGQSKYYKVGDDVVAGVALFAVFDDHIVLSRSGQLETLAFKTVSKGLDRSASAGVQSASSAVVHQAAPAASVAQSSVLNNLPDTSLAADIKRLNPQAFMGKYQAKFEADPNALLQEAGVTVAAGGRGYQIGQSQYAGLLESAGLKVNDVILSVNGHALGDTSQDASLLKTLASQKEVEVLIQRGERQFMVSFPMGR